MSLSKEAFEAAAAVVASLNNRVNKLFEQLSLPLKNKVQMDHYGKSYLFGKRISASTTDDELIEIIKSTPEKSWNGKIGFFGEWLELEEGKWVKKKWENGEWRDWKHSDNW